MADPRALLSEARQPSPPGPSRKSNHKKPRDSRLPCRDHEDNIRPAALDRHIGPGLGARRGHEPLRDISPADLRTRDGGGGRPTVSRDQANLAVVAVLLVGTYSVRDHSIRGYLVWLGVYVYLLYAFAIYASALHFQFLFLAYVLVLGLVLSFFTLAGGLMAAHPDALGPALRGTCGRRLRPRSSSPSASCSRPCGSRRSSPNHCGTIPSSLAEAQLPANPVYVPDLAFLLPAMIVTGLLIWRKEVLGSLITVPLLVFAVTMGLGIVTTFVLSAM
jgi:hypothetical protein